MDMFNRLKQRIAEELESEAEEGPMVDPGDPPEATEVEALRQEVLNLKEHINKNYFVYVKRLEKRKDRIKELEEYARNLASENESAAQKLQKAEGYHSQLLECRENLEQMENFQSQELAKVKHMLLSAETSLENEKKERTKLEERVEAYEKNEEKLEKSEKEKTRLAAELKQAQEHLEQRSQQATDESHIKDTELEDLKSKVQGLEERLKNQDLSGDERLSAVINERDTLSQQLDDSNRKLVEAKREWSSTKSDLDSTISGLRNDLEAARAEVGRVTAERDALRNQVLEAEIAGHEKAQMVDEEKEQLRLDLKQELTQLAADKEALRQELAHLGTEKETLEVTLNVRDTEMKTKKEEFRNEMASLQQSLKDSQDSIHSKDLRISALEAEVQSLKSQLTDRTYDIGKLMKSKGESEIEIENVRAANDEAIKALNTKETELTAAKDQLQKLRKEAQDLSSRFDAVSSNLEDCLSQLSQASEDRDRLNAELSHQRQRLALMQAEVERLESDAKASEAAFPQRLEQSDVVADLRRANAMLEDEVGERKKALKLQQQRMNDLKKTLQKELRSSEVNGESDRATPPPADSLGAIRKSPDVSGAIRKSPDVSGAIRKSSDGSQRRSSGDFSGDQSMDINFKYLKHVVFKFVSSQEYESKHLVKAIATLLKFTSEEERLLQETLEWKSSWFGSKPKLRTGIFSVDHAC